MIEIIRIDTTDDTITTIHFHILEGNEKWYKKLTVDIPYEDQTDEQITAIIQEEIEQEIESVSEKLKGRALAKSRIEQRRPVEVETNGKKEIRFRGRSDEIGARD